MAFIERGSKPSFFENKWKVAFLILIVLVIGVFAYDNFSSSAYQSHYQTESRGANALREPGAPSAFESVTFDESSAEPAPSQATKQTVEIKQGAINIDTHDAEKDSETLKSYTKEQGGYIDNFKKSDYKDSLIITLDARVPFDKFDSFFEKVRKEFKVTDSNVQLYRASTKEETTELDILHASMKDLEKVRTEINAMPAGKDKIDLLVQLTQQELDLKERINSYQSSLQDKQQQSELSTLSIQLTQEKPVEISTEDIKKKFNAGWRDMIENSASIVASFVTGFIPFILSIITYLIYAIIILFPAAYIYSILRKFYYRFVKK